MGYQNTTSLISTPADPGTPILGATIASDATNYTKLLRGISFAVAGAIKVTTADGDAVVIPADALVAGVVHPVKFVRLWSTGTAATGIVCYY